MSEWTRLICSCAHLGSVAEQQALFRREPTVNLSMNHTCGRTPSGKEKACSASYRKVKPLKHVWTTSNAGGQCKCVKFNSDGRHKMKRLRTRKERNQLRDGTREDRDSKSCRHFYSHPFSKDVSHLKLCCHNTSTAGVLPHIAPATHAPSVITDSRLLGHHGLFNHEVKSIDIERLLSEQRKPDRNKQLSNNSKSTLCKPAFAAHSPSNETAGLFNSSEGPDRSQKKILAIQKLFNHLQPQEKKTMESNTQCSDITPGQRPTKYHNSSPETNLKYKSPKHSSSDAVVNGKIEDQPALFGNHSESLPTPNSFNKRSDILPGSVTSFIECMPNKPSSAAKQTQDSHPTPQRSPSATLAEVSNSCDTQKDGLIAGSTTLSVKAIAAGLCNSVSFSLLRKRNLVAENRDILLKALRQRHGSQLQSHLLDIKQHLYSCTHEEERGDVSEPCYVTEFDDKEWPFFTDEFMMQFKATGFSTSSCEKTEQVPFDLSSIDCSNPFDQPADWFGIPDENPKVLDDIFRSRCSPPFHLDLQLKDSFPKEREHHFPLSPSFFECLRSSADVEDFYISAKGKKSDEPHSTEDYMCSSNVRNLRCIESPRSSVRNDHNTFHDHHKDSIAFPNLHRPSLKYFYGQSVSEEVPYFQQENFFEPFSHMKLRSASPVLRNQCVNLADYPPSHMLDRDSSLSTGSFLSPVHWSFPPMKLY